jgi:ubiquinone/menaquinone biosynthesis C-methylase UbiE
VEPYKRAERDKRDQAATTYDDWYRRTKGERFDRYERRLFDEAVPRRTRLRVLDLGSGTGRIAGALALRTEVVATDLSMRSLALNRRTYDLPVVAADSRNLPFRDNTFDVIVSCQVLQHLLPDDLEATLHACRRVLAPLGLLVVSVYNLHALGNRGVRQRGDDSHGVSRWSTSRELRQLARRSGFRTLSIGAYKVLPHAMQSMPGWERMDRLVSATPFVGTHVARYLLARFRPVWEA